MNTLKQIKKELEERKPQLQQDFHIKEIGIFGSYVKNEQGEPLGAKHFNSLELLAYYYNHSPDPYQVAEGSDCLLIITEWEEFKKLDLRKIKSLLKNPIIVDGRNVYEPEELKKMGFNYFPVGR